jgi:phospholipid/cholesterol/gamma-HCH transport system permease protein
MIRLLGNKFLNILQELGRITIFGLVTYSKGFTYGFSLTKLVEQIYTIGVKTLPVILLISAFTGMVLGLQGYFTLAKFGSEGLLGSAIALSLIRELGPVLTAIMIVGQAGSSMASEIGIMRNSEQIDALDTMNIDPLTFLIAPKLLAALIVYPILTAIFDVVGIWGGYLSGVVILGVDSGAYWYRVASATSEMDIFGGFAKSIVFAILTSLICCFHGYFIHTHRGFGATGVSRAATSSVVLSSVSILLSDYIITSFML